MDSTYGASEADRRTGNLLRIGTVKEVDYANALARVDLGENVTDWIPWLTPAAGGDRAWSTPDIGQQVMIAAPSGELSGGAIVGSLFQDAHPANGNAGKDRRVTFSDGTILEMDRESSTLNVTMNTAGNLNLTVGGSKIEMNTSRIKLTSNGSTLNMDSSGIKLNGQRIDLN